MRCIKCAKTFRTPPHEMRKTQICLTCTKKPEQRKTEKITSSAKWIGEKSKTINEYEVKFDSMKKEPESEKMQDLKNQQIKNQDKLIQIIDEIFVLHEEREILQKSIKLGKKQLEGYKEKKFLNRLMKFSMKKKKMVDHTKRFLSEKDSELEKNYLELSKKRSEQNICRIKIEEIIEKIIQIDKNPKDKKIQNKATLIIPNETEKNELKIPRIKETLIEEAERIKIELDELKKKKKAVDLSKNKNKKQSGNEIRVNITQPDIEDFVNSRNLSNTQPYTSVLKKFLDFANQFPNESITEIFENRFRLGISSSNTVKNQRSIINHFDNFLKSQNSQTNQEVSNEIQDSNQTSKMSTDKINKLISKSLMLIRKNSVGIYETSLLEELKISENEFKLIIPKLSRLEDIVEEIEDWDGFSKKVLKSVKVKEITKINTTNDTSEIKKITYKMVQEYIHHKNYINRKLKLELISAYQKHKSLSKIYEMYPNETQEKIRRHIITDIRLPLELKDLENAGGLHPNVTCSITIALYATDYFNWHGKKEDEGKILNLSKSISEYLSSDEYLNQLFQGKER